MGKKEGKGTMTANADTKEDIVMDLIVRDDKGMITHIDLTDIKMSLEARFLDGIILLQDQNEKNMKKRDLLLVTVLVHIANHHPKKEVVQLRQLPGLFLLHVILQVLQTRRMYFLLYGSFVALCRIKKS